MSASKRLAVSLPKGKSVSVAVVELPDGRIVARTEDELETLELEEQAAVAAALGLPLPAPGAGQ